jgi:hypothetical protein
MCRVLLSLVNSCKLLCMWVSFTFTWAMHCRTLTKGWKKWYDFVCASFNRVVSWWDYIVSVIDEWLWSAGGMVHPVKAYRGSRGIDPFILNISSKCWRMVSVFPWPLHPRERTPVPIEWEAGWAPVPFCTFWSRKFCWPSRISNPGPSNL